MRRISVGLAALTLTAFTGCNKPAAPAGKGPGGMMFQVVAVEARQQPVSESLALVGTIAPNEIVEIRAETDGTVEEVAFSEGQAVKKGQLLIRLEERKLAATVAESEATYQLSQANHERAKQLLLDKLISQQEFDQAAATFRFSAATLEWKRQQLRDARIFAPFDGITGARQISPGQVINRNQPLTWLVDLDTVKVEVNVPERYVSQLRAGQTIAFTVAAFANERFTGEVYFISPQLDPATRTALVKARIPNAGHRLKGGMFANLALTIQLRDAAIVIPEPALMSNGDHVTVFVVDKDSKAALRPVKVGLRLAGRAEITSGINAGDKVVVEGVQKIFPGAPLKLAPPDAAAPYHDSPAAAN